MPTSNSLANVATIASVVLALLTSCLSGVFVFGVYKTRLEVLEGNLTKLENRYEKLDSTVQAIAREETRIGTLTELISKNISVSIKREDPNAKL